MEDKDKLDRLITDEFKRLKIFRKSEGLTQVKMAEMLGKSQGNYTRWETGMYKIPVRLLKTFTVFSASTWNGFTMERVLKR